MTAIVSETRHLRKERQDRDYPKEETNRIGVFMTAILSEKGWEGLIRTMQKIYE